MSSLFSRLVNKGPENLTTEILAYLLNSSDGILTRDLLINQLHLNDDEIEANGVWNSQKATESSEETTGYFDLHYTTDRVCMVIENKFYGARMTDKQPNQYLAEILGSKKSTALLIMLVPESKSLEYWEKVKERVKQRKDWDVPDASQAMLTFRSGVKLVMLKWRELLESFKRALNHPNSQLPCSVILQQLIEYHDEMAVRYTRFEDGDFMKSNAELFRRITETVLCLRNFLGNNTICGNRQPGPCTAGKNYFGFYFENEIGQFWIGFSAYRWSRYDGEKSDTPFWFQILDSNTKLIDLVQKNENLKKGEHYFHDAGETMLSFPLIIDIGSTPDSSAEKCLEKFIGIRRRIEGIDQSEKIRLFTQQ